MAVGRFVEKKAPHLLVAAFAEVVRSVPEARLRWIGDGLLRGVAEDLADALGVADAIEFLGARPPEDVRRELAGARLFCQHSITAADGDSEGSPVAITEAAISGLPVVSTRHANIPHIVCHGKTGLLADERDATGFARHLITLLTDAKLAGRMGAAARIYATEEFDMDRQIEKLAAVVKEAARA